MRSDTFSTFAPLLQRTRTADFDEYGSLAVRDIHLRADSIEMSLELFLGTGDRASELWTLEAADVLEHRLGSGFSCVEPSTDHIVLRPYLERIDELTFYGRPRSAREVLGALVEAHQTWARGWFRFEQFACATVERLEGAFGRLAEGPASLMAAYQAVLAAYDLKPALVEVGASRRPTRWGWEPLSFTPVALILEHDFIIARSIRATLVSRAIASHAAIAAVPVSDGWRQCTSCTDAWKEDPAIQTSICPSCGASTQLRTEKQ